MPVTKSQIAPRSEEPSDVNWGPAQPHHNAAQKGRTSVLELLPELSRFRILSFVEAASFAGISKATLERLVTDKRGPPVVLLSTRRRGFRTGDVVDWINSRVSSTDGG